MNVVARLRPYLDASTDDESRRDPAAAPPELLDELMQRAMHVLAVMPLHQRRETIEDLLSPNDLAQGRRAVDALIEAAFVAEDHAGHLRRLV